MAYATLIPTLQHDLLAAPGRDAGGRLLYPLETAPMAITDRTKVNLPLVSLAALLLFAAGAAVSAYTARDQAVAAVAAQIKENAAVLRAEQASAMRGYVTHEEFLGWQLSESQKRDRQFSELRELILRRR